MIALSTVQSQIDSYIDRVLRGEQVACREIIGACRRHREDLTRMLDPEFPYEFNPRLASRSVQFFPMVLRHSIGEWAGNPFELAEWQSFVIWCIFGWRQKLDGFRRFRRAYISVARKNGKSTLVAGIALLLLHLDGEPGAEIYVGATKKDQAKIIHGEAEKMTRASPHLDGITKIYRNNLMVKSTNSFMRPVSSDKPLDGPNPHGVLFDELHAWSEQHRKFYDTMTSGSQSRRHPLFVTVTTAGDDKSHIWREEDDHASRVARGEVVDDRLFSFVARIDEDDDPYDEAVWEKANPNLGVSVKLENLRIELADAKNKPTGRNRFVRYHCNRRVSSVEHCFTHEKWMALAGELSDWSTADAIGIGIDLGGRDDLAAWAACARFPMGTVKDGEDNERTIYRYELRARSYMVSGTKRDITKQPWNRWLWDGKLTKADHVISLIRDDVEAFSEKHGSVGVAFDPHNARQMGDELEQAGLKALAMGQNHGQFNEPLRELINAADSGRLKHDGDEVLAWCATNAAIKRNSRDEWMVDKAHSREKVDAMVAAIMAFRMAYFATTTSYYYESNSLEMG